MPSSLRESPLDEEMLPAGAGSQMKCEQVAIGAFIGEFSRAHEIVPGPSFGR